MSQIGTVHVNVPLGSEKEKLKKAKRIATIAVKHGDHMLMGRRRDNGKWTVPGGHVDEGEDYHEGALRELQEEAGIHTDLLHPLSKPRTMGKVSVQPFLHQVKERPSTTMLKDPDGEVERWRWVNMSDGLPDDIADNLHVPIERNVLMSAIGETDVSMVDFHDMQKLIEGMDYEEANGTLDPNLARAIATECLAQDPNYYRDLIAENLDKDSADDDVSMDGLSLDLGSGHSREAGHIGVDTYPHDVGTIVHDLSLGIPFPDGSVSRLNLTNALHEICENDEERDELLEEIKRVLMPGAQFTYQGPEELELDPDHFSEDDHSSSENQIEKVKGDVQYKQTFSRLASPDAATANDAEPRITLHQYDMLPKDALLSVNAADYQSADDSAMGEENREMGYASQGALVENATKVIKDWFDKVFDSVLKGGPGSGRHSEGGSKVHTNSEPRAEQYKGHTIERTGTNAQNQEHHITLPNGSLYHSSFSSRDLARAHVDALTGVKKGASTKTSKQTSVTKTLKEVMQVPIFKRDSKKQIVHGVVLAPDEVDSQDDWMTAEDIEKAAHHYMIKHRIVGSMHTKTIGADVVESYIAPQDFETNDGQYGPQKVKKGSWVMGVRVNDKNEWAKVENGDYTGFSVGGLGLRDRS